jgi:hypothetical protein
MSVHYCASGDASADDWGGNGNRIYKVFTFVNEEGGDFHLASNDVGARNYGTNLSADANFAFSDDIDGQTRPGENIWDIGTDEYVSGVPPTDTFPPVRSNGSPTGVLATGTTQTTLSLTTNENATCRYATTTGISYSSMTNTFSMTGGVSHSRTITGLINGTTYNYYVRCQDTAGNYNTDDYTITFSVRASDTTTPATVSNLSVSNITQTSVDLTWTSPGDDGNTGTAASYDIRYSTSDITRANWFSATQASGEPVPLVAGTFQSFTVVGLSPATTYYFVIKTKDEANNWSDLSNVVSAKTQSLILFVSLAANPSSGVAPLNNVDLTVTVSGTAIGNINYTFYCNRSDSGIDITTPYSDKKDNISQTTYTNQDICSYSSPGAYTAKVIIERGMERAENRVTITVSEVAAPTPVPSGGGSGGGMVIDTTPPSQPKEFKAQGADKQIILSWENPSDPDFVRVVVLRATTTIPAGEVYSSLLKRAKIIYEGTEQTYNDINLDNDTVYYYAIYAYDQKPNYSQPVIISAQPIAGKTQITPPTPTLTPAQPIQVTGALQVTGPFSIGMKSEQVKILQQMLAVDPTIYLEGLITGYYGPLTQLAVQRFQCQYNIVCSGTPETTGYGMVGPVTKEKLNEVFATREIPSVSLPPLGVDKQQLIEQIKGQIKELQQLLTQLLSQLIQLLQQKIQQQTQ